LGGTARYEALVRFVKKHGEELTRKYEELLLGKVVEEFLGTVVNYHVKGDVRLSNGEIYETHYRWSSEEEDYEKKELPDSVPMEEYYNEFIVGKTIIKVSVSSQRDDECYIYAFVDKENHLEIPLGFNPEYDNEEKWRG